MSDITIILTRLKWTKSR